MYFLSIYLSCPFYLTFTCYQSNNYVLSINLSFMYFLSIYLILVLSILLFTCYQSNYCVLSINLSILYFLFYFLLSINLSIMYFPSNFLQYLTFYFLSNFLLSNNLSIYILFLKNRFVALNNFFFLIYRWRATHLPNSGVGVGGGAAPCLPPRYAFVYLSIYDPGLFFNRKHHCQLTSLKS